MFDKIAKAYQALTDEESRENWEKYGNPDGPTGRFSFSYFIRGNGVSKMAHFHVVFSNHIWDRVAEMAGKQGVWVMGVGLLRDPVHDCSTGRCGAFYTLSPPSAVVSTTVHFKGVWWYNSIKYNVDKVLLDTTQLFYYFLHKTPKMEINRELVAFGFLFLRFFYF